MSHRLFIVCGPAGAGKTTYGQKLAAEKHAALLDIDVVTERLAKVALQAKGLSADDRDSRAYKTLLRQPVYDTLFDVARHNLAHIDCVIVGPFTRECADADWPIRLRAAMGCEVEFFFVTCDDVTRKARIKARGNPRDAHKLEHWASYAKTSAMAPPPFDHHLIDTAGAAPGGL